LLCKLQECGVEGIDLEWFTDYLFNRSQIVAFDNDSRSDPFTVNCGVPQGSILGPLLFLIFFNDFPDVLEKCQVVQFADDTVVYVSANNAKDIESLLNNYLRHISHYFQQNELVINLKPGKTEFLLFGTSKRLACLHESVNLTFNGIPINESISYKYLGTTIDRSLQLTEQFDSRYHV